MVTTMGFANEKTLTDYWNLLIYRWRVVVLVFIVTLLIGAYYVRKRPPAPYPYMSVIEIANTADIDIVTLKLKLEYIIRSLLEHAQRNRYTNARYVVSIDSPKENSRVVVLQSSGSWESGKDILDIHRGVVQYLLDDDQQRVERAINDLQAQKFKEEINLDRLRSQEKLFSATSKQLDTQEQLLSQQITEVKAFIASSESNRSVIVSSEAQRAAGNESLATALLLVDNDIEKQRKTLHDLEQQLLVGVKKEREGLKAAILENIRQQKEQVAQIERIQFAIDQPVRTKVLIEPSRLLQTSLRPWQQIMLFFGISGIVLGVLAVFFVEFIVTANAIRRGGVTIDVDGMSNK